jgi:hypothetical protein
VGEAHLDRVGDRPDRLGFEGINPAVPELLAGEDPVEGDRRVAAPFLPVDADARPGVGGVAHRGIVAAGARDRGIGRQPGVEVELTAQFDLGPRERIGLEALDLTGPLGEPEGQFGNQDGVVAGIGQPGVDLLERDRARPRHAGG